MSVLWILAWYFRVCPKPRPWSRIALHGGHVPAIARFVPTSTPSNWDIVVDLQNAI